MQKMRIFISGKPRCGKSTIIKKVIENLNVKVAGISTPEIRNNSRAGFEIIDIASKEKGTLASKQLDDLRSSIGNVKSKYKVGNYYVNVSDIDRVVSEFEKSLQQADLLVIDEIGKMEFFSEKFKTVLKEVLNSDKPLLAALHRNFVREFENYGEIILVNEKNRDSLPEKILEKLRFILNQNKTNLR